MGCIAPSVGEAQHFYAQLQSAAHDRSLVVSIRAAEGAAVILQQQLHTSGAMYWDAFAIERLLDAIVRRKSLPFAERAASLLRQLLRIDDTVLHARIYAAVLATIDRHISSGDDDLRPIVC